MDPHPTQPAAARASQPAATGAGPAKAPAIQRAFDAGWYGLGLASVDPAAEWTFSGSRPVELTLALDPAATATLATHPPEVRLSLLADGLTGQGAGPDLRAASWSYRSVLQQQDAGVRAGFDRRSR